MERSHHQFNLSFLSHFRLQGLWGIYLNIAFRDLGLALIDIFIPLYLFKITASLEKTFLFYALYHLMVLPASWFAGRVAQKIGLDVLEFISVIWRTLFLLALILAKIWPAFIWPAAIFWGITIPFCWLPYHYTVVSRCNSYQLGQIVSRLDIISKLMVGLGPFLGGLVIFNFDFALLYFFAIVAFLISGVVIFLDDFDRKKMRLDFRKIIKRFLRPSLHQFWLGMIGKGIESEIATVAWPLYIFLMVSSYTVLGGIQSVSFLISIITLWLVGKWVDKKGMTILNFGIVGNVLNWLIRPFLISGLLIFLSDLVYKLLSILIWVPFMTITYKKAAAMHKLEFFIQREWSLHLASGLTAVVMAFLVGRWHFSWNALFALGISGLLLCTLIVTPGVKIKKP
jgi:hypothetical protein